jgi:hypothetical protein
MTEEKKKKREWVKNAAIIFLIVLLFLTFLLQYHSEPLPAGGVGEVRRVRHHHQPYRGTGTVTALESYEVKATIQACQECGHTVDQQVSVGDVLFTFPRETAPASDGKG